MLRFVKPGDIFCFKLDEDRYCFGRIITLMTVGHLSELFDIIKKPPGITELEISNARRIIEPIIGAGWGFVSNRRSCRFRC